LARFARIGFAAAGGHALNFGSMKGSFPLFLADCNLARRCLVLAPSRRPDIVAKISAICGFELQRREDRRRKSIETDHPGCFLKYSGRRKTGPTGEFCP
jgi:hypothetical protein